MGYIKYLKELRKNHSDKIEELDKQRIMKFRSERSTKRIKQPTKPGKARSRGYKAKQGFVIVRQRVRTGGRQKEKLKAGRKSSNTGRKQSLNKNYQAIAEEKASVEYPNLTVLNSYEVVGDGKHRWYEVILVDKESPSIQDDLENLAEKSGRVERGLTSSGRKSRGLRKKGKGAEKKR